MATIITAWIPKRWDIINGNKSRIIIEINTDNGTTSLTVWDYNKPKNKFLATVKLFFLKVAVHYS